MECYWGGKTALWKMLWLIRLSYHLILICTSSINGELSDLCKSSMFYAHISCHTVKLELLFTKSSQWTVGYFKSACCASWEFCLIQFISSSFLHSGPHLQRRYLGTEPTERDDGSVRFPAPDLKLWLTQFFDSVCVSFGTEAWVERRQQGRIITWPVAG